MTDNMGNNNDEYKNDECNHNEELQNENDEEYIEVKIDRVEEVKKKRKG